ncbi:MAG: hypothetical protein IKR60_02510 [Alphaproteobacteria bacterium]|nr:hypothetical protein [Alphaproteobacteria bacterium]
MLTNILYTLDQSVLLLGIFFVLIQHLCFKTNAKSTLKTAEVFIICSLIPSVIFYNKGILPQYFETSAYTTTAYVFCAAMVVMCLKLSRLWSNPKQDFNVISYSILALVALIALNIICKTNHLAILFGGCLGLSFSQYGMLLLDKENEQLRRCGRSFFIIMVLVFALFALTLFLLRGNCINYVDAASAVSLLPLYRQAIALLGIFCPLFFMLGIAPFHFWKTDHIASLCLPVACFFVLVPTLGVFAALLKVNTALFMLFEHTLQNIYLVFGVCSVIFAVIGMNSSRFLNKIFAFAELYALGCALMVMSVSYPQDALIVFLYIELYLLFMLGVYTCLHGLKSNGTYLNHTGLIAGLAKVRPYMAAALMFFILLLMALPPLTGMTAQLMILGEAAKNPWLLYIILFGLLCMMPVYLKIIQSLYFKQKENPFDRVDTTLYLYLTLIIILCIVIVLKPDWLFSELLWLGK